MLKKIIRLLPFVIVTLLSIGGVELFYNVAEHYLLLTAEEKVGSPVADSQAKQPANQPRKHQDYKVIVERNLFKTYLVEKTPVKPETANPLEGLENTSLDLVLMGTITGQAGRSRAVILEKAKRKQEIYYKGDFIQEAEIKDILRGKVILSYQGKDEVLDMTEAASMRPKQVEQPAVSPAPPRRRVVSRPSGQVRRRVVPARAQQNSVPVQEEELQEGGLEEEILEEEREDTEGDEVEIPPEGQLEPPSGDSSETAPAQSPQGQEVSQ